MKEFLSHHNVAFETKNVQEDVEARDEMMNKYESMATPTVVIGEEVIVGYDPGKMEKLLNL